MYFCVRDIEFPSHVSLCQGYRMPFMYFCVRDIECPSCIFVLVNGKTLSSIHQRDSSIEGVRVMFMVFNATFNNISVI